MEKLNARDNLKASIMALEQRRDAQRQMLKEQVHTTFDTLRPINLIKSTLKDVAMSRSLKGNVVNTSVGLTVGYVAKILFQGFSRNPVRRIIASALMFGVTNIVAKNPKATQKVGGILFRMIRGKQRVPPVNNENHREPQKHISASQ
jgi:hypothetical protein